MCVLFAFVCGDAHARMHMLAQGNFYEDGGCVVGLSPKGAGAWEPFAQTFHADRADWTIYIPQEATAYSSWVVDLRAEHVQRYTLPCDSPSWRVHNGNTQCNPVGTTNNGG